MIIYSSRTHSQLSQARNVCVIVVSGRMSGGKGLSYRIGDWPFTVLVAEKNADLSIFVPNIGSGLPKIHSPNQHLMTEALPLS